jgi:hypothetical protein
METDRNNLCGHKRLPKANYACRQLNELYEKERSEHQDALVSMLYDTPGDSEISGLIFELAMEVFDQKPIPIAPVKKLLASKVLCKIEKVESFLNTCEDLMAVVEQITLLQELEIFERWSGGKLKESSAMLLLKEIRGEDVDLDMSAIFNGEPDGD